MLGANPSDTGKHDTEGMVDGPGSVGGAG